MLFWRKLGDWPLLGRFTTVPGLLHLEIVTLTGLRKGLLALMYFNIFKYIFQ